MHALYGDLTSWYRLLDPTEDHAEEARLLYVAATRARDRLIISGPTDVAKGYARWPV